MVSNRPIFSVSLNTLTRTMADEELSAIAGSGIPALEVYVRMFDNDPGWERRAAVSALAAAGGPRVYSLHAGDGDLSVLHEGAWRRAVEEAAETIETATTLGARQVVFHASGEPIVPAHRELRFGRAAAALAALVPAARRHGVKVAVEALPRTCLGNTADELVRLIEPLPSEHVGVCIDTNHLMGQYRILPETIRRLGPRLLEIHASDYDGIDEKHQMPGTGVVDWPAVMSALREVGFAGPVNYEVGFGKDVPLAERLRKLTDNIRWLGGL